MIGAPGAVLADGGIAGTWRTRASAGSADDHRDIVADTSSCRTVGGEGRGPAGRADPGCEADHAGLRLKVLANCRRVRCPDERVGHDVFNA